MPIRKTLRFPTFSVLTPSRWLKGAGCACSHHSLPLSGVWGDGSFASSDAQRVAVEGSSLLASFYPRYFGFYERAVGVYTHISDQHSVFASRVISCAPREALYVRNRSPED